MLKFDYKGRDLAHDYESPWSVLKRAHSFNQKQRLRAVESIAAYKAWDGEYCNMLNRRFYFIENFYLIFY